ncbi:lachesin isoform X2 [Colletes latitarsis]|uniref:lachesin isoform X2 n=1 Tax=Colletes latitarsis TaxID=2605962 RepID=UPI004035219D
MRVARLLLYCVLLEDCTNLGRAAIISDATRQDASATNPTLPDLPSFTKPIGNVTAAIGKEAILPCTIRNLGKYKVGWLRMEDQTILSMDQRTVTHSLRFLVTVENAKTKNQSQSKDEEEATSRLHIRQLREADRGCYMCQLNTNPMLSQLGCVDVLVPPDILSSGTSESEVSVSEGENATLSCNATGRPPPRVFWRREKSGSILMRGPHDQLIPVPPSAKVADQLLGSPLNTDVSLICLIEAYPKTINLWTGREPVFIRDGRYEVNEQRHPDEEWKTTIELKIRRLEETDLGEYTCSASSSMGRAEATVRLYKIERETPPTRATSTNWKKLSKGKSKVAQVTSINRMYHQMSTPAMQKSTSRIVYNKYATTSTTMDPRAPFIKDEDAFHNRENPNAKSRAYAKTTSTRIYAFCLLVFLGLR